MTDLVSIKPVNHALDCILHDDGIIFTYERPNLSEEEKVIRMTELLAFFPDYVALTGVWQGQEERSFWVPYSNHNLQLAVRLADQWNQDAILINKPSEGKALVWGNDSNAVLTLSNLQTAPELIAVQLQCYTKLCLGNETAYLVTPNL